MDNETGIIATEALENKLDRNIDKKALCEVKRLGYRAVNSFNYYRLYNYRNLVEHIALIWGDRTDSVEEVLRSRMKYVGSKTAKLIVRHLQEQGLLDYISGKHRQMLLFE